MRFGSNAMGSSGALGTLAARGAYPVAPSGSLGAINASG